MLSRKGFACAALALFLALLPMGRAVGTERVPAGPGRWSVTVGSLDVMGAAEVRVVADLELERPRSADLSFEGFVKGTAAVRLVCGTGDGSSAEGPRTCGLELTGRVLAADLPRAAVTAVRCTFGGSPGVEVPLPEGGLKLSEMSGYAFPEGPKPSPEFMEAASARASGEEGGCDLGLTWTALLLVPPLIFGRRG